MRFQRHGLPLATYPSPWSNQARKSALVAFSTTVRFPSSYLRIPLPANMQEVVEMTHGCVAHKTSFLSCQQH